MKVVIIDDEEGARNALSGILNRIAPDLEIIGQAGSVAGGLELLENVHPNLVFLDIQMPDGSGFDLINLLKNPVNFEVVFITAHDEYAIEAFRISAIDYLLKPIRIKELQSAVEKAKQLISLKKANEGNTRIEALKENTDGERINKLVIPDMNGFALVDIENIIYIEGMGNYSKIRMINQSDHTVPRVLKEYEELLSGHNFLRIHRSFLINLKYVNRYIKGRTGQVEMADKSVLNISRDKKEEFLNRFSL